jgi:hypothetical protein
MNTEKSKDGHWFVFSLIMFFLFIASVALSGYKFFEYMRKNRNLTNANRSYVSEINSRTRQLDRLTVKLHKTESNYKENIARLKKELEGQKKKFEAALLSDRQGLEEKKATENKKLRDEFAAKRLETLEKISKPPEAKTETKAVFPPLKLSSGNKKNNRTLKENDIENDRENFDR